MSKIHDNLACRIYFGVMNGVSLSEELQKRIVDLLLKYGGVDCIVLFGSRARGDASFNSDIDLAVISDTWDSTKLNIAKNELEETVKTPLKFDLLLYKNIRKQSLLNNVNRDKIILYDRTKN